MLTKLAPRAFNRMMYHDQRQNVFYGTDDGAQDGSFREFTNFERHYHSVAAERRDDIHMISVIGGLYGLNFIPLWRPRRLTFFDVNPAAITYFQIIRHVFTTSCGPEQFLRRLTEGDYAAETEMEEFIRENIRLKQQGRLPRERGSTKRSYPESFKIALDHYDLTKQILNEAPLDIRTEAMECEGFRTWIRSQSNVWIYASNITEFHFFSIEFTNPVNNVAVQIIYPGKPQLIDLAPLSGGPVRVDFEIPLVATRIAQ